MIGTTIDGRYAIEAGLGEGGMGVVYRARHVLIDKPVAIKILRKEAAQDAASVQRFIQEAKSASKINHSNIVDITDFGVLPDGNAYFVMEFLQGQTLAQAIHEGPLDPVRVCVIGAQMARGLHAAHSKGIVHRDLKPENIFLLEREGQKDFVKIVDFGIAKVGAGQRLTQVGMVLGTPEYMSPEQATGQETDHRVDQYALGCIMYEMLTGAVPFLGERPAQTLTKHVFEPVVPPSQHKPELNIPPALESVVLRTLGKKPAERFPSMRELDLAIGQVESELRGGRVVVDESRLFPSNPSLQLAAAQLQPAAPAPLDRSSMISSRSIPGGAGASGGAAPGYAGPTAGYTPAAAPALAAVPGQPVPYSAVPVALPPQSSGAVVAYAAPVAGTPYASGQVQLQPQAQSYYGGAVAYPSMASYPPPSEGRPTKESLPTWRTRRNRTLLAAGIGLLFSVAATLGVYHFLNAPPAPLPRVETPPRRVEEPAVPPTPSPLPKKVEPPAALEQVQISIRPSPGQAAVYIDSERCQTSPCQLVRPRGSVFHLEVKLRGHRGFDKNVRAEASGEMPIDLGLRTEKTKKPKGGKEGKEVRETKEQPVTPQRPSSLPNKEELRDPFGRKKPG